MIHGVSPISLALIAWTLSLWKGALPSKELLLRLTDRTPPKFWKLWLRAGQEMEPGPLLVQTTATCIIHLGIVRASGFQQVRPTQFKTQFKIGCLGQERRPIVPISMKSLGQEMLGVQVLHSAIWLQNDLETNIKFNNFKLRELLLAFFGSNI